MVGRSVGYCRLAVSRLVVLKIDCAGRLFAGAHVQFGLGEHPYQPTQRRILTQPGLLVKTDWTAWLLRPTNGYQAQLRGFGV